MFLLKDASAVAAGGVFTPQADDRRAMQGSEVPVQAAISDTATVIVQGRCASTLPWVTLATFTESGAVAVLMLPQMRASVTDHTAGTVDVALGLAA
jgi:hypothetical protein